MQIGLLIHANKLGKKEKETGADANQMQFSPKDCKRVVMTVSLLKLIIFWLLELNFRTEVPQGEIQLHKKHVTLHSEELNTSNR